jgi:hypothetical protein
MRFLSLIFLFSCNVQEPVETVGDISGLLVHSDEAVCGSSEHVFFGCQDEFGNWDECNFNMNGGLFFVEEKDWDSVDWMRTHNWSVDKEGIIEVQCDEDQLIRLSWWFSI